MHRGPAVGKQETNPGVVEGPGMHRRSSKAYSWLLTAAGHVVFTRVRDSFGSHCERPRFPTYRQLGDRVAVSPPIKRLVSEDVACLVEDERSGVRS